MANAWRREKEGDGALGTASHDDLRARADPAQHATQVIRQLEAELSLFDFVHEGMPVWEALRYPLHSELVRVQLNAVERGQEGPAQTPAKPHGRAGSRPFQAFMQQTEQRLSLLEASLWRNPLRGGPVELAIFGHSRRKLIDGEYVDLYTDPLLALIGDRFNCRVMERRSGEAGHLRPAANKDLRYLDRFQKRARAAGKKLEPLTPAVRDQLQQILVMAASRVGGRDLDLKWATSRLVSWRGQHAIYRQLLEELQPKAILLVASTGFGPLIHAAKAIGIPTAELQHGSPAEGKLNYDFPPGTSKTTFPDYFLSFGSFWAERVSLPLPAERIIPIGFAFLDQHRHRHAQILRRDQLLIISQHTLGQTLADAAVQLASKYEKIEVRFKLHPLEQADWRTRYPQLIGTPVRVLDAPDTDLYAEFAASRWQLGVYSTALYEGLAFGCETFVLKGPGWSFAQALVDKGAAHLVDDIETLDLFATGRPVANKLSEALFKPVDADHITALLASIMASGSR